MFNIKKICFSLLSYIVFINTSFAVNFKTHTQTLVTQCALSTKLPDLVDRVSPSVVNISVVRLIDIKHNVDIPDEAMDRFLKQHGFLDDYNNPTSKTKLAGSGFLISKRGHIVTNYHVVKDAVRIEITINGNQDRIYRAKVLGRDPKTDLALVKIHSNSNEQFPFLNFADSDLLRVGDPVFVVGDSFGFQGSVSQGIVSAKNRDLGKNFYTKFIQTDASINIGNSGGPMLDMNGNIVGVNTALVTISGGNEGVGFAVPSNVVRRIISVMMENDGRINRSWLGITFQSNNPEIAKGLHVPITNGAIITNVLSGTPAEKAMMKKFDIIVNFNGQPIKDVNTLPIVISETPANKQVPVTILRNGKKIILSVTLQVKEEHLNSRKSYIYQNQGISVKDINIKNKTGIVVIGVKNNSESYIKGLRKHDIILSVNNLSINNIEDFRNIIEAIEQDKKKSIAVLYISRENYNFFLPITVR